MAAYLRYVLKNLEPLRIADDATSQSGQTNSLRYIPGSTIRGLVISNVMRHENNPKNRKFFMSAQMCFLNCYLTTKDKTLMPSPKGFYEDKTEVDGKKTITNLFTAFDEELKGKKRADLGRYCYLEDGCIHYYGVNVEADLKINLNGSSTTKVFRNEKVSAGQYFEGYVKLSGTGLDEYVTELLKKDAEIIVGNNRSSGCGKCKVILAEKITKIPYAADFYEASGSCYMMLLSNTVMRDEQGEYCGLNLEDLADKLGVTDLAISKASTSTRLVNGYNRTWQTKIPSVNMYDTGSIFKLVYKGTVTPEKMKRISDEGIGVRTNEGFGRILFLKDYESLNAKISCKYQYDNSEISKAEVHTLSADDRDTLRIAAKGYYTRILDDALESYVVSNRLETGGVSKSKIGTVESIITMYRYQPKEARKTLNKFFGHDAYKEEKQRVQKVKASIGTLEESIDYILNTDLNKVLLGHPCDSIMGIPLEEFFNSEDEASYKLKLLIKLIRFDRKEEN